MYGSHVLLNGPLTYVNIQLEEFATNPFRSPQSILARHLLDQGDGFSRDFWFDRSCSGLVFPIELEPLTMPTEERLWLNDEKRLLPGSNHPGQKHQDHPVRFGTGWSFHLSTKNNELLTEKSVFCHEFGLASSKVCRHSQHERGSARFCPGDEAVVKRLKTKACQPLDDGEHPMHSVRYPPCEDEQVIA